ncbi:MAG: MaoC family dehydratase N-terminal domain-containing protein [Bifidobacteriaceae bacterium]|jgi:acyl dehydratase|nr:MaoC family dehydratase N-terminal domain-containing protein [Bifidobacteriaceae bacterium]
MSSVKVKVGDQIGPSIQELTRADLVRYAGASGDFNPIHYSESAARAAGLPNVIVHGMLTMGQVIQPLVDWAGGDPGAVLDYAVRFARPVPVPESGAVQLTVTGQVSAVESDRIKVNLTVTLAPAHPADGVPQKVLGKAQAILRRR